MPHKDPEAKRAYQREYRKRPEEAERLKAYMKSWQEQNGNKRAAAETVRRMERRGQVLVSGARIRAKRRGLDFDLDGHVDEIQRRVDAGRCELTKWPFCLDGGYTFDSPSLDRIDSARGYTIDNVRVVLVLVNNALGGWGEDTLRMVMQSWLSGLEADVFG